MRNSNDDQIAKAIESLENAVAFFGGVFAVMAFAWLAIFLVFASRLLHLLRAMVH